MAKRSYKKSSRCPEPFNTLIDIAGAITMGAIADHMEKKHRYTARGKINPYAVSAIGIGSGRLRTTEDLLRTGAVLGAAGSFDVDPVRNVPQKYYIPDDPVFDEIKETKVNNNRYAWRMNCEDGSPYGISPFDYETRNEYNLALEKARGGEDQIKQPQSRAAEQPKEKQMHIGTPFLCCRISRLDNGANEYYLTEDASIQVGSQIAVQTDTGYAEGIVIGIKKLSEMSPEELPSESMWIITEATEE